MSTEHTGSVSVTVVTKEQNQSFLDDKIDLKKLAREISKASKEAIDVLVALLSSTDEKVRMQAAIKLLEFDIDIKKTISQDQLQRLIAEIKLNRDPKTKQLELDEGSSGKQRPLVDFGTIVTPANALSN